MTTAQASFVLIHGGGSSSWDWHLVTQQLRQQGHEVIAPDLPITEAANGPSQYAAAVVDQLGKERKNLVVVGHSFGGFTAPLVCAHVPTQLLVLVAGMVPAPGEAPKDWWRNTGHDQLDIEMGTRQQVLDTFYQDVPPQLAAETFRHSRSQNGGWQEVWPLNAWPDVPTRFLLCRQDRVFPPDFVRKLVSQRLGLVPDEIDGSHSVFLSRPKELALRLEQYWLEYLSMSPAAER